MFLLYKEMYVDNIINRFWSKINASYLSNDKLDFEQCWLWNGNLDKNNYGRFFHHKEYKAHRVSYELYYKHSIPTNILVCHKCDNTRCVNPTHLFLGSYQDNIDDMVNKNRQKHTLISDQIKNLFETIIPMSYFSPTNISKQFNCHIGTISDIKRGITWKHI